MPSISRIANGEKTGKMDREKEEGREGEGQKRKSNGRCEAKRRGRQMNERKRR